MEYQIFEGKSNVRKPARRKLDQEAFPRLKQLLGINEDQDLVSLCIAVSLFKFEKSDPLLEHKPSFKEMAKMQSYKKAKFYDFLIISYLNIEKNRMDEFEKHVYDGFKYLVEWNKEKGPDCRTPLESFVSLSKYLES